MYFFPALTVGRHGRPAYCSVAGSPDKYWPCKEMTDDSITFLYWYLMSFISQCFASKEVVELEMFVVWIAIFSSLASATLYVIHSRVVHLLVLWAVNHSCNQSPIHKSDSRASFYIFLSLLSPQLVLPAIWDSLLK